jgi:hypothetical protein
MEGMAAAGATACFLGTAATPVVAASLLNVCINNLGVVLLTCFHAPRPAQLFLENQMPNTAVFALASTIFSLGSWFSGAAAAHASIFINQGHGPVTSRLATGAPGRLLIIDPWMGIEYANRARLGESVGPQIRHFISAAIRGTPPLPPNTYLAAGMLAFDRRELLEEITQPDTTPERRMDILEEMGPDAEWFERGDFKNSTDELHAMRGNKNNPYRPAGCAPFAYSRMPHSHDEAELLNQVIRHVRPWTSATTTD